MRPPMVFRMSSKSDSHRARKPRRAHAAAQNNFLLGNRRRD
jgi:hypothetical protein